MEKIKPSFSAVHSVIRLFVTIGCCIFVSELLVMLFLNELPPLSVLGTALFDSSLLLVLTFPILYFTVHRPLTDLVTERQLAQAAIDNAKQRVEIALEGSQISVWETDLRSNEIWLDSGWSVFLGKPRAETRTTAAELLTIAHPDDRHAIAAAAVQTMKGEISSYAIEHRIMSASGEWKWILSRGRVVERDAGSRPLRMSGTNTNITESKQAEQALRAAEEQFRSLVEQSIAGTYIIQDGKLTYANPRLAEIFGYSSADELIGRDPLSMIAEQDRAGVAEHTRQWIEGEVASISYDFTGVRKDGSMFDVGVHSARASYRGRPAVLGLVQDISEKKHAEMQIQRYIGQLKTAFMSTVEVASILGEMRDPYTAGHVRRVAELAAAIGAELGLDVERQEGLRVAGHLHDIGQIIVPAEILSRPGKLSVFELQLVQGHAQASYDALKGVEFPWPVAEVALQHHERMDGSGYPRGLKGGAILLEARIVAVADVVEAMSSHRPYRAELGIDKALAEIERGRGTVYDADVVDACLRLFREGRYQLAASSR
jgi:PAS domain S-box-containing protein